jgi:hypothetical protein
MHSRIFWNTDFVGELSNNYGQITLKYKTDDGKEHYIVFERKLSDNFSYHYWKVFIVNYTYFA